MIPRRVLASCLVIVLAVGACAATNGDGHIFTTSAGGADGVGGAGQGGASAAGGGSAAGDPSTGDGLFDGGPSGSGSGGAAPACAKETQYVYTIASDNSLYKFDPPTLKFTLIGFVNCPTAFASPFSMGVDRDAQAWVVFTDGSLFKVDTKDASCKATGFMPGQHGFSTFGMGFSSNAPGSSDETLFVSDSSMGLGTIGLAKIDLQTLKLTPIGMYDKLNARAEMTGTGDAKLFGAFEGMPYNVAQIDKTNAKILTQAPQMGVSAAPGGSNFAFAAWGGDFWLFVGPGAYTDVFQYKPASATTTKVLSMQPQVIVGAGVSTCAPIVPPA